jgi:hypothetical protein
MCVRTYTALLGLKQGRALARRGVPGERRYAPVLENAQVRSTAEDLRSTALCQARIPRAQQKTKNREKKKIANLIFLDFIYTKARNKIIAQLK